MNAPDRCQRCGHRHPAVEPCPKLDPAKSATPEAQAQADRSEAIALRCYDAKRKR